MKKKDLLKEITLIIGFSCPTLSFMLIFFGGMSSRGGIALEKTVILVGVLGIGCGLFTAMNYKRISGIVIMVLSGITTWFLIEAMMLAGVLSM